MLAGDDLFDQRLVDEHLPFGQLSHGRFESVIGDHIAQLVRCFAVTIAESGSHGNHLWFTRQKGMSFLLPVVRR
jgi:hypothetical protein